LYGPVVDSVFPLSWIGKDSTLPNNKYKASIASIAMSIVRKVGFMFIFGKEIIFSKAPVPSQRISVIKQPSGPTQKIRFNSGDVFTDDSSLLNGNWAGFVRVNTVFFHDFLRQGGVHRPRVHQGAYRR